MKNEFDSTIVMGAGEANARLAEAAHDLLEACKEAELFVAAWAGHYAHEHGLSDWHPAHRKTLDKVRAAIAKAEGK